MLAIWLVPGYFISPAMAQATSQNGWFKADYNKACAPFTIHLTETDTFPPQTVRQFSFENNGYFVSFNSGDSIQYTYNNPGIYKLVEVVNKDYTGKTDTLTVTVFNSTLPDFKVFTCSANGVLVEINDGVYDAYRVYYTPSDSIDINNGNAVPPYTYPAGDHQVSVKGLFTNARENCGISTQNFTTINRLVQASFNSLSLVNENSASGFVYLTYDLAPNIVYQLDKAENLPAGFQKFSSISGADTLIGSLDTQNKIQLFRIAAYDACKNQYLYSDTLASITLKSVAENNQNHITWSTYPVSFQSYQLYRDRQPLQALNNGNINYYIDKNVSCFNTYCYSMVFINRNGHKSYSDTSCVEAYSIYYPPPVTTTTVSAAEKGFDISWESPKGTDIKEYFVQRILNQDIYSTLDTVETAAATDTSVDNTSGSFCYSVSYLDQCKNRSNIGYTSCSVYLTLGKDGYLSWTPYSGWENGVKKYIFEVYDEQGKFQREIDLGLQTGYKPNDFYDHQINSYRVRAESKDSISLIAYSNYVIKDLPAVINVPNSFTPDGDGLNDTFKAVGTEMQHFTMKIYSRTGNLIYESSNENNGWDGTYNGSPAPQDTYIFDIIAEDFQGRPYRLKGALLLLRHKF